MSCFISSQVAYMVLSSLAKNPLRVEPVAAEFGLTVAMVLALRVKRPDIIRDFCSAPFDLDIQSVRGQVILNRLGEGVLLSESDLLRVGKDRLAQKETIRPGVLFSSHPRSFFGGAA